MKKVNNKKVKDVKSSSSKNNKLDLKSKSENIPDEWMDYLFDRVVSHFEDAECLEAPVDQKIE